MNKYEEALKRAKSYFPNNPKTNEAKSKAEMLENIFPELAESEDEMLRKEIILLIDECKNKGLLDDREKANRIYTWLEKQKNIVDDYEDRLDRCACSNFNKGYEACLKQTKKLVKQ